MRFSFLLTLLVITSNAVAQSRVLDSLNAALDNHPKGDSTKVTLLNQISFRVLKYQPERSDDFAKRALSLALNLKFENGVGEAKNNLAVYHLLKGKPDVALGEALESVKIAERKHNAKLLANSYAILGNIYHNQSNTEKALYYLAEARKLNSTVRDVLISSRIFNSLGLIAVDKKEFDSAMFYFKRSLKIMTDANEDYRVPEVINNMGLIYGRQGKNEEAIQYYRKSLEAAKKGNNHRAEALALVNLGSTILSQGKYAEAEKVLLESLALSKETGEAKIIGANYMALGQLKNETGKFNEAHVYLSAFYEQKDSLLNIERVKKIAELEIQYDTEKKEHAIQLLERDKKIQALWANILVVSLLFATGALVVLYHLKDKRDKEKRLILDLEIEQLTTQNKELSEKYKDVLASITTKTFESSEQRLLKKAIDIVEQNISNPLFGVEQMADEMNMSRTNMHRKIKAITGFPPSELIRNIRLRKAATLLLNKTDSVSQISFSVGFEDHSYFSKSFKKQFGVTPSEYPQSLGQLN
jgi:AraC-like DNA-binding protein/Tfp pilus assembly protein PilF